MKFRFHGLAALLAAACLTSCFGIDNQLGDSYIATNQKYDIYTAEFDLEDIEMACPDRDVPAARKVTGIRWALASDRI